ncbi:Ig-like domain-containing protein [Microbulbifer spongiae]|uniref:Ig-like domain-containing protein n=1 Tax=Microbulbifer spongiae TaxID=2944933 RepID=A0ABY9ECV2_9GAMM|nr:Ig-like domain-containing protein [Microbulbifer sp. MI-G]WKD50171.1 Ig-like domain-containing protein [Microbulbifer sp. MI-G]
MTLRLFWIILLGAVLAGCDSDNNNNQVPRLVSISIFPAGNLSLAPGETQQYIARANFSNGTSSNISNSVNWQSEDSAVVTVNNSGVATAVAPGSTRIFASLAGIVSNRTPITVSGVVLTSIQVTPAVVNLPRGNSQQLTALGTFSDGSTADITDSVAWRSDNTTIATVDNLGEVMAVAAGSTSVFASQGSIVSNTVSVTVTNAVLTSIQVTPAVVSLPVGNSQQLTALGNFSDGSTLDITSSVAWRSDNTAIATVDSLGEVVAVAVGSTSVSASQGSIVSNTVSVTVINAVLTSIQVTPAVVSLPAGNSQQLTALGNFSDGSTLDITSSVVWLSDNTAIATVDSLGEVVAVAVGSTSVSASQGSIVSNTVSVTVTSAVLTSIQVTPAMVSLPAGNSQQLTALGNFSDGSTLDITTSVDWHSDNTAIATVDSLGEVVAVAVGNTSVFASQGAIVSNTVSVTVTSAVLTSIQVTPAMVSLPAGNSQQLTALGNFSDGSSLDLTTSVDWHSDNTAIATVDSLGEVVAVAVGSTSVFASQGAIVSNTVPVTVTNAVLTSIQVTPTAVDLAQGRSEQLTALGNFSDGSSTDITTSVDWHSDNTAIATVDSLGEVTGVGVGSTSVFASQGSIVSNTVPVTVVALCNIASYQGTQEDVNGDLVTKTFYCAPTRAQVEATGTFASLETFTEGGMEFAKLDFDDMVVYCFTAFGGAPPTPPFSDSASFVNANLVAGFGAPPFAWPVSEPYLTINALLEYVPITLTGAGGAIEGPPEPVTPAIRGVPICTTTP